MRVVPPQPVEDGRLGELDRVTGARRRDSPAGEDDESYEGIRAAVSHIALNESTSSDAPPTRAPSTSGCARRAPALSGLTDPPGGARPRWGWGGGAPALSGLPAPP